MQSELFSCSVETRESWCQNAHACYNEPDHEAAKHRCYGINTNLGPVVLESGWVEDTRAVAAWAGAQELLHDRVLTVDDVVERVNGVNSEEIERVASQYLVPEHLNLAIVGPYRSDAQFRRLLKVR